MLVSVAALLLGLADPSPQSRTVAVAVYDDDPITIVGRRDGGTVLVVDVREVATRCRACQKEISRLERLAQPYVQARDEMRRDMEGTSEAANSHNRHTGFSQSPIALEAKRERLALIWEAAFGAQGKEVSAKRAEFGQQVRNYLLALAPHIVTIAEAERRRLGASAVINNRRAKLGKAKRVDITAEVIRKLDEKSIDLSAEGGGGAR